MNKSIHQILIESSIESEKIYQVYSGNQIAIPVGYLLNDGQEYRYEFLEFLDSNNIEYEDPGTSRWDIILIQRSPEELNKICKFFEDNNLDTTILNNQFPTWLYDYQ